MLAHHVVHESHVLGRRIRHVVQVTHLARFVLGTLFLHHVEVVNGRLRLIQVDGVVDNLRLHIGDKVLQAAVPARVGLVEVRIVAVEEILHVGVCVFLVSGVSPSNTAHILHLPVGSIKEHAHGTYSCLGLFYVLLLFLIVLEHGIEEQGCSIVHSQLLLSVPDHGSLAVGREG